MIPMLITFISFFSIKLLFFIKIISVNSLNIYWTYYFFHSIEPFEYFLIKSRSTTAAELYPLVKHLALNFIHTSLSISFMIYVVLLFINIPFYCYPICIYNITINIYRWLVVFHFFYYYFFKCIIFICFYLSIM